VGTVRDPIQQSLAEARVGFGGKGKEDVQLDSLGPLSRLITTSLVHPIPVSEGPGAHVRLTLAPENGVCSGFIQMTCFESRVAAHAELIDWFALSEKATRDEIRAKPGSE